jgi:hypothetical protein
MPVDSQIEAYKGRAKEENEHTVCSLMLRISPTGPSLGMASIGIGSVIGFLSRVLSASRGLLF